ncbi:hypothetical protein VP01_6559g2 [Puccinia sorghi]|uniref:DUF659 domain-containing protein n=1 Tax=Puccinia sorghi TaxID=27349 RepID=A0A0L6UFH1_9BASI|nr:hypothetical protein VP01_6559g2 [Puccinia sorghi]
MALKVAKRKYFLDVLDLHSQQHTANKILLVIKGLLKSKQVKWRQKFTVVTDSPSTMIKLNVSFPYNFLEILVLICYSPSRE